MVFFFLDISRELLIILLSRVVMVYFFLGISRELLIILLSRVVMVYFRPMPYKVNWCSKN